MADLPTRIALVYDRVNKWGGAEAVLLALHDMFPTAPLYTSLYSPANASWAKVFPEVIPTFLQNIPFLRTRHELVPWLTPLAFESINFNQFEAVISVTSADAKGIITTPRTFHLCYCLTPTRYLWSHYGEYSSRVTAMARPVFSYLKRWDKVAASRPDQFVAISQTVRNRIWEYYSRESQVVYPPVDVSGFDVSQTPPMDSDYFLYLGRLVSYKHPELVIDTFNRLNKKLVVIGTGSQESRLHQLAGPNTVFKGFLSKQEKIRYLQHCKALVFFHEEDFGIVPVEAMAVGKPVIALARGGAAETIVHNKTGILIEEGTSTALMDAIAKFTNTDFDPDVIKIHAKKFSNGRFSREFAKIFLNEWTTYNRISTS